MEEWRHAFGRYYVSNEGRVRGLHGVRKLATDRYGYKIVNAWIDGVHKQLKVHRLVAKAFVEGSGEHVRHLDGDPANNHASNLAWGSASENTFDQVRLRRHRNVAKTHCSAGHPYDEENTGHPARGGRICRTCNRIQSKEWRERTKRQAGAENSADVVHSSVERTART